MANNGAPDSWEQQADNGAGDPGETSDLPGKFSTLNVNAAEFVPSFLPRQAETLPKTESPESPDEEVPVTNGGTVADEACCRGIEVEEPPGEGAPPPPADSWEEAADGDNDPLLTPENEPEVEEDEDEAEEVIKPKKRPVNKTEETKSKKEHVNVVFIGHVDLMTASKQGQDGTSNRIKPVPS